MNFKKPTTNLSLKNPKGSTKGLKSVPKLNYHFFKGSSSKGKRKRTSGIEQTG